MVDDGSLPNKVSSLQKGELHSNCGLPTAAITTHPRQLSRVAARSDRLVAGQPNAPPAFECSRGGSTTVCLLKFSSSLGAATICQTCSRKSPHLKLPFMAHLTKTKILQIPESPLFWIETLDQNGTVRSVRPQSDGPKVHYMFDANGNYIGKRSK